MNSFPLFFFPTLFFAVIFQVDNVDYCSYFVYCTQILFTCQHYFICIKKRRVNEMHEQICTPEARQNVVHPVMVESPKG